MKFLVQLLILLLSFYSNAQTYCPGDSVHYVIATDSIPVHQSSYQNSFGCWSNLTEFIELPSTVFPSGLDVGVIITDYTGAPGSIVDHFSLTPINLGDTLYIRKNNISYDVKLRHQTMAGFGYELAMFGVPTEFNEPYNCSFHREILYYQSNCMQIGYGVNGSGNCVTCYYTGLSELTDDGLQPIMIIDFLGSETEDKPNTLLIHIYSDGTTKKIFRVE